MKKQVIFTPEAPAPIGPYNQGILVNGTLYVSGQIALNAQTGAMHQQTIEEETHQVLKNIQAVLLAAGMDFSNIVKASIFILDMHQFARINEVYQAYFKTDAPARETVQVAALPKNANVEISVIAVQ